MSENDETVQEVVEEKVPELNIGAALVEAREALGLSVEDAAHQLRLSPRQLVGLEANDYSGLPGATFVRGFIRNYARLLQLDPEPLLLSLGNLTQESAHHAITLQSEDIAISHRDKRPWIPYAMATAVVGILLGGWLMYMDYRESHPVKQAETESTPTQQATQQAGGYSPEVDAATAANTAAPTEMTPQPMPADMPTPAVTVATTAPAVAAAAPVANTKKSSPEAGSAHIKIVYGQQSWVRINDRDGKEILHKNGPAGSEDLVDGKLPLKVEVGNVAGVQITFNDKPVDLTPHTKANVARFTLE